jgi:hypothetical protein
MYKTMHKYSYFEMFGIKFFYNFRYFIIESFLKTILIFFLTIKY